LIDHQKLLARREIKWGETHSSRICLIEESILFKTLLGGLQFQRMMAWIKLSTTRIWKLNIRSEDTSSRYKQIPNNNYQP
jgi:hypothetical protein